jgi:hypothetical protein
VRVRQAIAALDHRRIVDVIWYGQGKRRPDRSSAAELRDRKTVPLRLCANKR